VRLVGGHDIFLLGAGHPSAATGLGGSRWAANRGHLGGVLPALDLEAHARLCALVRELVGAHQVAGVHDVSDGGLGVALAEMAIASGVGFRVTGLGTHGALFSEAPSRVVLCVADGDVAALVERTAEARLSLGRLGRAGGDRLVVEGLVDLPLDQVNASWRDSLPGRLAGLVG
jgi:phosphoribosylformylglycinamidine synthase subunit PurL